MLWWFNPATAIRAGLEHAEIIRRIRLAIGKRGELDRFHGARIESGTIGVPPEGLEALEDSRLLASRGREGSDQRAVVGQPNGERQAGTPESPEVDRGVAIFGLTVVDGASLFADVGSVQAELAI
ncbi:MAG: hypothetical protein AB7O37_00040 [Vicinamibacteria bacterium]